jgi:hypothetical protein
MQSIIPENTIHALAFTGSQLASESDLSTPPNPSLESLILPEFLSLAFLPQIQS